MRPDQRARLAACIAALTGEAAPSGPFQPVSGGCINDAFRLGDWFIKCNRADRAVMFEAEFEALTELAKQNTVRVPKPLWQGLIDDRAYIVMEYLPLRPLDEAAAETLARQLATLHQRVQPYHGWHRDNTIGSTPQPNASNHDWPRFWRDQRIGHQLRLAADHGHRGSLLHLGRQLLDSIDVLLADHHPQPALLHGDLWAGNAAMTTTGLPVIFDPASYYGDRETDIAMTELFGGFGHRFYAAYREVYPLDAGYSVRRSLYNLYHVLNHLNLFGGTYLIQAQQIIEQLLAECR